MLKLKQHKLIRRCALLLVMFFLLPAVVNFIHSIKHNHKHELCDNFNETHLHKLENDCDFCKFKLNQGHYNLNTNTVLVQIGIPTERIYVSYSYQYNCQQLSFSLRGPPTLV